MLLDTEGERGVNARNTDAKPRKGKLRHRGKPDSKRRRTSVHRRKKQVGYPDREGERKPKAARESDQPIVL